MSATTPIPEHPLSIVLREAVRQALLEAEKLPAERDGRLIRVLESDAREYLVRLKNRKRFRRSA